MFCHRERKLLSRSGRHLRLCSAKAEVGAASFVDSCLFVDGCLGSNPWKWG